MLKRLILVLLMIIPLAAAYQIDYNIESNNVLTTIKIQTQGFQYQLPIDATAVSVKQNNKIIDPEINNNILIIPQGNIEFSYITNSYLEKGKNLYFVTEFTPLKTERSTIKLILPEQAFLDKENPIYPDKKSLETDGKKITIVWEEDLNKEKPFPMFVTYKQPKSYTWIIIPLAIIILVLFYFLRKKPKTIEKTKVIRKKIDEHLTSDEKAIVNALKKKQGECEQATLRIITDFSKASLSRLLTDMEKRKLIKKVKKGKKNIVILK